MADAPFDLAGDRLFRAGLVQLADDDHLLGLFLHHIVCDGPSKHVLFEELGAYYAGEEELPALSLQFTDCAERQRETGARPGGPRLVAGAPRRRPDPAGPARRPPRTRRRSGRCAAHTVRLPGGLVEAGAALVRSQRTTPFTVMTVAYAALLGHLTGAAR
ncbi:condensation domain-containing protein [Streptomyces chiangmaiensis]|uniref:Condensation domain-containing protein n=1 Tax=Streptomyces chiangmaiensis TaxID=766497 RepID=A0ABU7FQX5_9ACTN|nr:condensation domain-containing protein [Streptomyces chiangmaiensis]MED7826354.1 condensation domain-containing protein [Streptomyces chiangmaiensis]